MSDYYNINGSHLTYVEYKLPETKGPVVVEPMVPELSNNYLYMTKPSNLQSTMTTNVYDMDPSGNLLNYPVGHPKYEPSFQDTRIQDAQALQQQENNMFLLGTVAGLSLIVLSFMIYKQQTAE